MGLNEPKKSPTFILRTFARFNWWSNLHNLFKYMRTEKGKSLTINEIFEKLAHYCAYQDRCHYEVEKKLDEFHLIPEARDHILIELIQQNFLNEERFSESFVRGKFNQKKWGKQKIRIELKKRKIPQKLIDKSLNQINETDYLSTLTYLFHKKQREFKTPLTFENKYKITRFLLQKGYEYDLIQQVWEDFTE